MSSSYCERYPDPPYRHQITLPGGAVIMSPPIFDPHSQLVELESMIAVLTPALAGLVPLFTVIEVVLAVGKFCKALATLNPGEIADATVEFVQALDKLLGIIPQVSFPLMIVGLLLLAIDLVTALITFLEEIALHQQQIQYMKEYAQNKGLEDMLQSALCLEANLVTQLNYFNHAIGSVAAFMAIIELLAGLIGVDFEVDFSVDEDAEIEDTIDRLQAIRDTLQTIRDAIPL